MRTFYIKQKIFTLRDRYYVYDGHKQPVYEVTGKFFSIGDELTISDLNGNPLFRIKQRVMSFFGAYDVYQNDILCATIKRRATFFRPKLDVESNYGKFEIHGDFWDYDFSITKDGHTMGTIEKECLTFSTVPSFVFRLVNIALLVQFFKYFLYLKFMVFVSSSNKLVI